MAWLKTKGHKSSMFGITETAQAAKAGPMDERHTAYDARKDYIDMVNLSTQGRECMVLDTYGALKNGLHTE